MQPIRIVATVHKAGWEQYGRRMAQSVVARWPRTARLTVYAEGFEPDVEGVDVRALPAWLGEFKARHAGNMAANGGTVSGYSFRFDAVKFAHKVAALTDFGARLDDGVMIWLDADTFTHSEVTEDWLDSLFPEPAYLAWLDRHNCYPECGFVMFRPAHDYHGTLMRRFRNTYASDAVFKMAETHDSYVLQQIVNAAASDRRIPAPQSLSGRAVRSSHPFACGPLSSCIDHFKGARKKAGRTPANERAWFVRDNHPYWAT